MSRKAYARVPRVPRRRGQNKAPVTHLDSVRALREWLLPDDGIFSRIKCHGNSKWSPIPLVWLALCWAWSDARNVTDAFLEALDGSKKMCAVAPLTTYQGFMGALVTWTPTLLPLLCTVVQERMAQIGGKFWRIDGWVPIAFDGSRSTAPRTVANEVALCAAHYGSGQTAKYRKKKSQGLRRRRNQQAKRQPQEPQAWITLLWHMGLRLPWSWRLGPSNASERGHVMALLQADKFPKNSLFCGDAGFVGYPLWSTLCARGHDFLVRVGANVRLLHEQSHCHTVKEGKDLLVLCWPTAAQEANQPPLRLRLLKVRLGKTAMWMLTSVLDRQRLTAKAAVRFYKMRWGIEVEFRGLKQTLERGKLRCRNDRRLLVELDWSILAMAVAELFALKEQLARKAARACAKTTPPNPAKRSLAKTVRALRSCLRNLSDTPEPGQDLTNQLCAAVTDDYIRKALKRARYRPPNTDKKPLGDPKLRPLERQETYILQQFEAQMAA
jgi:hypothetical protein